MSWRRSSSAWAKRERERATAKLLAKDGRDIETARTRLLEEAHSKHRIAGRLVGFEKMGTRQDGPYRVGGVFVGRVHGARESFAIIEKGNYSKLMPWRPQMDRAFGQQVAGQMHGRDFDFKYGKGIKLGKGLGIDL